MGWYSDDSDEYNVHRQVMNHDTNHPHKASWSHELIAGAAAYEAAKAYENYVARQGHPDNHAKAKEILAGFVGAFVDRIFETKGLDYLDKERVKHHANERLHHVSGRHYGNTDPYVNNQYGNDQYGNNPYGNNPYGNNPYDNNPGNNPYDNNPYGNNSYDNNSYGNNPYPNNPYGNNQYNNNQYGNNPYGNNPYGNNQYGNNPGQYDGNPYERNQYDRNQY